MGGKSPSGPIKRPGRSFSGCLTCRKRKVKCDSQATPCGNCRRMKIVCKSSFWTNFINSSPDNPKAGYEPSPVTDIEVNLPGVGAGTPNAKRRRQDGGRPVIGSLIDLDDSTDTFHLNSTHNIEPTTPSASLSNTAALETTAEVTLPIDLDSWSNSITSFPLPTTNPTFEDIHELPFQPALPSKPWQADQSWPFLMAGDPLDSGADFSLPGGTRSPNGIHDRRRNSLISVFNDLYDFGSDADPQPILSPREAFGIGIDKSLSKTVVTSGEISPSTMSNLDSSGSTSSSSIFWSPIDQSLDSLTIPQQLSTIYMEVGSAVDQPLVRHYESYMSKFFSVKAPKWNLYTYMLRSPQGSMESPLRHSMLAWTGLHLSRTDQSPSRAGGLYYVAASNAVDGLIQEMSAVNDDDAASKLTDEKIRMLLAATFFLSHCDIMTCEPARFHERMEALKAILTANWEAFQKALTAMSSRLLLWLAYLEVRAALWGGHRRDIQPFQAPPKSLLDILEDHAALPTYYIKSRAYLRECFGSTYPTTELDEDLLQQAGNLKLLDIMSVFSLLISFEKWNDSLSTESLQSPEVQELRNAKIRLLRAEIARIRAECQIAFELPSSMKNMAINRTSFHWLTVTALHRSATILLNRILEPNIRTDEESQSAARELLSIALRLRNTKYLRTPRSFFWPLPIFIAGIEIQDEIYQDWTLSYMEEMGEWGSNMMKVRELLEAVIGRQGREERRVKVRHVMEDLGRVIII